MKKRPPETLLEHAVAAGGLRKGSRVTMYVTQWIIAQQDLGHEPTVEEVATWWKESRATWFRHQAEFRELFPDQDNPSAIAAHLIAQMERNGRKATQAEAGSVMALLGSIRLGLSYGAAVT